MNSSQAPIPIPPAERWRDLRVRFAPALVLLAAIGGVAVLWRSQFSSPTLVGQAEPKQANVSCYKAGLLIDLNVTRFQRVKAGDPVARVMVADPAIAATSVAVIQAEIESLRQSMQPVTARQRNAMDYSQLRLNWMRHRAQLASDRVNLELAENEFRRTEDLFKDGIASQRAFDQAKAARERLRGEVEEMSALVAEGEQNFAALQPTNSARLSAVSDDPLRAAIAAQEAKLRLTEAELSPILLRAPIDGVVASVSHHAGEAVTAGTPIVVIVSLEPMRILGYLRAPILSDPKPGTRVEVRTRGLCREKGQARIMEVGAQLENIPTLLQGPATLAHVQQGLPLDISLPPNLSILPGELVDIVLLPDSADAGQSPAPPGAGQSVSLR